MQTAAKSILVGTVIGFTMGGCHRLYQIQGAVQVAPSAAKKARLPAILCSGPGGPLEWSFVHGHPTWHPTKNDVDRGMATIFCSEPQADQAFPLDEAIDYGSLPREAHIYAWLAPVPAAQSLCAQSQAATMQVDPAALYQLKLDTQAATHRGDPSWPCGQKPDPASPMNFVITFDPEHKTWEVDDRGHWIEHRTIRLE